MQPEEALEAARRSAARRRAEGDYGDERAGESQSIEDAITPDRPGWEELREWSIIEPDSSVVYSTRRAGAPITAVKRGLLRLLRQYTTELEARQTRFNVAVVSQLQELRERVAALERRPPPDG